MANSRTWYRLGVLHALDLISEAADAAYLEATDPERPSTTLAPERAYHAGLSDAIDAVLKILPAPGGSDALTS